MIVVKHARLYSTFLATASALVVAGCAGTTSSATPTVSMSSSPMHDPRVGLKAGLFNAQEAAWNMRVVSETQPSADFMGVTNSDLAFLGNYAIQGSYNGYQVW